MRASKLLNEIKLRQKSTMKKGLLIRSSPGIGKTQIAEQAAIQLDIGFKNIHVPTLGPEDYSYPVISADKTQVRFIANDEIFPLEGSKFFGDNGILCFDELSQGDVNAQRALANLIQERNIHGRKLKKGWTIVATGNRIEDRAGANRLLTHLLNRLTVVSLDLNVDDWVSWAFENNVKQEVIAFIRYRPDLLNTFDPNKEINATPRSWVEGVSANSHSGLDFEVISGDVGEGPASEYIAFAKIYQNLPSLQDILDGKPATVPNDTATKYAVVTALSHRCDSKNLANCVSYLKNFNPEFLVLFIRDAIRRNDKLANTKAYIKFITEEGADLLGDN